MAQLAEQLTCNQQVIGSSPIVGLWTFIKPYGWIPEWPKGTDCKSAANCFGGSNPPLPIRRKPRQRNNSESTKLNNAGWSSLEARRAHNPKVIGSNPVPATQCPDSSVGRAED